jgi:hypothetical protein
MQQDADAKGDVAMATMRVTWSADSFVAHAR